MTPQEQQMLQGLTDRVNQTVLQDKDPEAEQYLTQSLSRNPDAIYILAQTVLVQQYALDQAKKQLDDAKQQLAQQQAQPVKHTSFLGSLLGHDDDQPRQAPPPPSQGYQPVQGYSPAQPQYAPPPQYGQPQYGQPVYQPGFGAAPPSGGGGFLRSAIQTAGGVAAGALAFEGIESLMHGFGEHAGYGGGGGLGMGGFGGGQPRGEEVVNNYYDGDRPGQDGVSRDIEDRRDDGQRDFSGDSGNQNDNLDTVADDTDYGTDDSSGDMGSDDSSSFDDSNS